MASGPGNTGQLSAQLSCCHPTLLLVEPVSPRFALQLGLRMHTFPRPAIKLTEWSFTNVSCPPDKPPQRNVPFSAMSNLLDNAEEVCPHMCTHSAKGGMPLPAGCRLERAAAGVKALGAVSGAAHPCGSEGCLVLQIMVNFHLAPYPRPDASFVSDAPKEQHHKGWQVCPACGYVQSKLVLPHTGGFNRAGG